MVGCMLCYFSKDYSGFCNSASGGQKQGSHGIYLG